ncbi:MAG: hypothetical protein EOO01_06940 [Chitinophagaceae bacterium]|nr:MAG: hypothetical protein EOO01_06940 [Chitinophagaceae bacterium]
MKKHHLLCLCFLAVLVTCFSLKLKVETPVAFTDGLLRPGSTTLINYNLSTLNPDENSLPIARESLKKKLRIKFKGSEIRYEGIISWVPPAALFLPTPSEPVTDERLGIKKHHAGYILRGPPAQF